MNNQVKSKQRVASYGEVFTSPEVVNAMLDLVKQETERIDSRFLEPACGTGNFLVEILRRKLDVVEKTYRGSQLDFERYLVLAISSIYGIDILEDNVLECRKRLFELADQRYTALFKKKAHQQVRKVIVYILSKNILWGDALTLRTVEPESRQIIFSEWSFPMHNSLIKRREFVFSQLIPDNLSHAGQPSFLTPTLVSDLGESVFIPTETSSYPLSHFLKLEEEMDFPSISET